MEKAKLQIALICATSLIAVPAIAGTERGAVASEHSEPRSLEDQFSDPPNSARPRVWWHWMNGNVTKDGIAKDLAWMKRVGVGGAQNFDASIQTPQIVDHRLSFMSPEWKEAFRFAASEADRLGLELAIASSPGWTETGGPWVAPGDAMKKVVWSETRVPGNRRFIGRLAVPPSVTGPYQSIKGDPLHGLPLDNAAMPPLPAPFYVDTLLLALPDEAADISRPASYVDATGNPLDGAFVDDDDLATYLELPRPAKGMPQLQVTYERPTTVRSASLFLPGAGSLYFSGNVAPRLESSDDGKTWRAITELLPELVPTTVAFAPVTARHFRLVFAPPESMGFSIAPPPKGVDFGPAAAQMADAMSPKPVRIAQFRLSGLDRIDRAEAKAGFAVLADYTSKTGQVPEAKGIPLARVINLTGKLRPDGSLDWMAPPGKWRVLRFGYSLIGTMNHPASKEATGLEVDKLDAAAVRRYLEQYLSLYRDAVGSDLIGSRGVKAILNDSIEVGPSNWTRDMVAQFRRLRGYDPVPWLPALTGVIIESRAETDKFLYDYRTTIADLTASAHYGTIAAFAHESGLKVYGEALEIDRPQLGDDLALRSHADVPMAALWYFNKNMGPTFAAQVDLKGASSVAHIYGRQVVAAESMTSYMAPWAFGPADLKHVIDFEFASGINLPVIHTSVHVPTDDKRPGLALSVHGQHFNRAESWAELAKPWVDYIARNSLMLQQGRNVADLAYFYGEEAPLTGLYSEKAVSDAPRNHAFDFINADALWNVLSNDGSELVTPGGARYKALYLGGSSRMMSVRTLRKLEALVRGGATLIGRRPIANLSRDGDDREFQAIATRLWSGRPVGKGRVLVASNAEEGLALAGVLPDVEFQGDVPPGTIRFVHRKLTDGDSYFVSNSADRPAVLQARFRVSGRAPEVWRAETGERKALGYKIEGSRTTVPLTLAPNEAVHVVFRRAAVAQALTLRDVKPVLLSRLEGPWQVSFEEGRGAPATKTFAKLAPLDEDADAGVRYFSGVATYTNNFGLPKRWKRGDPLWLDLGDAKEVAEVTINGQLAGYAWHSPFRVDVGRLVKSGRNALEVRVANLWVNRLIGDRQPGAKPITWTASPTYRADAPLRKSGLIGPVTLLLEQ